MRIRIIGKPPYNNTLAIYVMKALESANVAVQFRNVDEMYTPNINEETIANDLHEVEQPVTIEIKDVHGKCKCRGFYQPVDCPVHGECK